ncbi:MAG: hypothetical protein K0Q43_8 [Ramlibacter sp.]|jgi:hypothetical protein|nr:hypothetical protein [Ramlibacter sp.]
MSAMPAIETTESQAAAAAALAAGGIEPIWMNFVISDPEVILAAKEYPDGRARTDFLLTALKIGVLSLRTARGVVDGDLVRKEGDRLLEQLGERLNSWRGVFEERVTNSLSHYFDPKEGKFVERVERLVKSDGDLATVVQLQVQGARESLSKVFEQFIGENSQLLKVLDPSGENQLVMALQRTLDTVVQTQNAAILGQFSLDNKDSALTRFLSELAAKHGDLNTALSRNMSEVVAEFSLDRPDSALSRLVNRVETAQRSLTSELSLDNQGSALCRLQAMLQENHRQQLEISSRLSETLNVAIGQLQARRQEADKSTRHGIEFEATVGDQLRSICESAGDVVQDCGLTTGLIPNKKVGDFVITIGPEKAAAGARIVIEAKESASYDLASTLEESDVARRNRGAAVCVFIHSEKTAQAGIPVFNRYGHDIVVRWNAEDPATDVWLKAALMVATAMSVRAAVHDKKDAASFQKVDEAVARIRKQVEGFEQIRNSATTSSNAAGKILERAKIMEDTLLSQLETLCEQVAKLKARQDTEE